MPLIDLRTDLKSLKYGADRQGGGDSGLPYIKKDINTANPGIKFDDGLVRGGTVNAAVAGAVDTARIAKFLVDAPKGPLFLIKQIGLQLSNPRLEIPKNPANIASGIPDNLLAVGTKGLLEPTRIYNLGINTLAQIPVNAFGIHFNRHGILPIQTKASKYEAVVTANNDLGGSSKFNRLVGLTTKFKLGDRTPNPNTRRIANAVNSIFSTARSAGALLGVNIPKINLKPQDLIVDDYAAGPTSVYGIGRTTINRYSNTEDGFKINLQTGFSRQFAGYTRDTNNQSTPVKIKNTVDFKVSTLTRSVFASPWKYAEDGTLLDNSFLNRIGSNNNTGSAQTKPTTYIPINYYNTLGVSTQYFNTPRSLESSVGILPATPTNKPSYTDQNVVDANIFTEKDPRFSYADIRTQIANQQNSGSAVLENNIGIIGGPNAGVNKSILNLPPLYGATKIYNADPSVSKIDTNNVPLPITTTGNYSSILKKINNQISGSIAMKNSSITSTSSNDVIVGEQLPTSLQNPVYKNNYGDVVTITTPWNKVTREIRIGSGRKDEINLTPIFDGNKDFGGNTLVKENDIRDLVRFRIQAVNTDTPDSGRWMVFRAYLTDLSDDTNSSWSDIKYAGRGDTFYIYTGFTRKISIGFKVAALSVDEMKFIYQKLNFLMSNTMPDYKGNVMRGPLIRMSVGNWIDSQLGILNNINFKVPNDSPWEISLNDNLLILPHIVEVNMTFTPIGSETAGINKISEKSSSTSNIAQNNAGDTKTLQYIQ